MYLGNNQLTGEILKEIQEMKYYKVILKCLYLYNNQLTGEIS